MDVSDQANEIKTLSFLKVSGAVLQLCMKQDFSQLRTKMYTQNIVARGKNALMDGVVLKEMFKMYLHAPRRIVFTDFNTSQVRQTTESRSVTQLDKHTPSVYEKFMKSAIKKFN